MLFELSFTRLGPYRHFLVLKFLNQHIQTLLLQDRRSNVSLAAFDAAAVGAASPLRVAASGIKGAGSAEEDAAVGTAWFVGCDVGVRTLQASAFDETHFDFRMPLRSGTFL